MPFTHTRTPVYLSSTTQQLSRLKTRGLLSRFPAGELALRRGRRATVLGCGRAFWINQDLNAAAVRGFIGFPQSDRFNLGIMLFEILYQIIASHDVSCFPQHLVF